MRKLGFSSFFALAPVALSLVATTGCAMSMEEYDACVAGVGTNAVPEDTPSGKTVSPNLRGSSKEDIEKIFRASVQQQKLAEIEGSRREAIALARCGKRPETHSLWGSDDGEDEYGYDGGSGGGSYGETGTSGSGSPADSGGGGAKETSKTNNQVDGVDEADIIKNDNRFLYLAHGNTFEIVDAFPAKTMHESAKIEVPGQAKKLFVEGDRAVVYSSVPRQQQPSYDGYDSYGGYGYGYGYSGGDCTYGYDCVVTGDGNDTAITVFDISDRQAPKVVRTLRSSSSLIAARKIGHQIHTVLADIGELPVMKGDVPTYAGELDEDASEEEVNAAYDKATRAAIQACQSLPVDIRSPTIDDDGALIEPTVYQAEKPDGQGFTTLLSFDLTNDAPPSASMIFSKPGTVYASADSLYFAVSHNQYEGGDWYESTGPEASTVHKFRIGAASADTAYVASGVVKGRVLNQFSMDEYEGHLRIATTSGHLPDPDAENTLTVLETVGPKLTQVGIVDGIAKSEDIRSVRFEGDRGYVVTFKKTDPLFVFDLKDPRAPRILGELKIPGFSTYMHRIDANHLLSIGYDANDHGDFAYFDGVILQLFDVTNPVAPVLLHKEKIGTRGSSSDALTDHLAFTYFAERKLLAIPMSICEGGGDGEFGTDLTFSGLMVYDVSIEKGFSLRGRVAHPNDASGTGYDSGACSNWWSQASSVVKRSVFMDDFVYSVSDRRIKANGLQDLSQDISQVDLGALPTNEYGGYD